MQQENGHALLSFDSGPKKVTTVLIYRLESSLLDWSKYKNSN